MREVRFSDHALSEMARRGLMEAEVRAVLDAPAMVTHVRQGRVVAQGLQVDARTGGRCLVRVFVDVDRVPPVVVAAYRTTKFATYGGGS